jgi:outer membrane lipoprotein SlyB
MKIVSTAFLALSVLALGGCASSSPDVIKRGDAQRLSSVQDGVVLNVRAVTVDGSQSGLGGAAGAVVGGVAGSGASNGRTGAVVGVVGAVVGAVAGNAIERASTRESALEILVQMPNGERRAIVQAQGAESFQAGDQVVLISTGSTTRVSRAQSVQPKP